MFKPYKRPEEPPDCPLDKYDYEVMNHLKECVDMMRQLVDATTAETDKAVFQQGLDVVAEAFQRMQKIDIVYNAYTDMQATLYDWLHGPEEERPTA